MNIIQRNFFRLLRAGAFGNEEQIEPMSAWKWRQVCLLSRQLDVAPLLLDGVRACSSQFFMHLNDDLLQQWQDDATQAEQRNKQALTELTQLMDELGNRQLRPILMDSWPTACLYPTPLHHCTGTVNIFFPFETQGNKADEWAKANGTDLDGSHKFLLRYQWKSLNVEHRHRMLLLNNRMNNTTLQSIIEKERLEDGTTHILIAGSRIETVSPTLNMLMTLLGIMKVTLSEGLRLWQIVDLGMLLRKQGDQVDFVKLQSWMERLHFTRMAQLVGTVLTGALGFADDEVPFVQSTKSSTDIDNIIDDLFSNKARSNRRFFRYSPGESIASIVASITHTLGNVEE